MKKTFPLITILITISLFGLIFFQILWLKSIKQYREQQLKEHVIKTADMAGRRLMEENLILSYPRKNDLLLGDRLSFDFRSHSVIQRFKKEEISNILKESFDANIRKDVHYEYEVTEGTYTGDPLTRDVIRKFARCSA